MAAAAKDSLHRESTLVSVRNGRTIADDVRPQSERGTPGVPRLAPVAAGGTREAGYAGFADGAVPAPAEVPGVDDPLPDCVGFGGRGGRPSMMSLI